MKNKLQETERQRLAKADIECPLCNQNRSSEGYGDWICSPCYNKLLGDLRKEGKASALKEELKWMEEQIVSRYPIDIYNRTLYLKQAIKSLNNSKPLNDNLTNSLQKEPVIAEKLVNRGSAPDECKSHPVDNAPSPETNPPFTSLTAKDGGKGDKPLDNAQRGCGKQNIPIFKYPNSSDDYATCGFTRIGDKILFCESCQKQEKK